MEKELRKRQNLLMEAGKGVILFALWRVASINLYLGLSESLMDMVHEVAVEAGINEKYFLAFLIVVVAGVLLFQLSIRLYIGQSAKADARGKRKSWLYLVVAAILLALDLQFSWESFGIADMLAGEKLDIRDMMSFCMELASAYVLLELLISGIRVKLLRKKMKV